jgi:hypothetical protein
LAAFDIADCEIIFYNMEHGRRKSWSGAKPTADQITGSDTQGTTPDTRRI